MAGNPPTAFDTGGAPFPRMRPPAAVSDEVRVFLASTKFYRPGRPLLIHQILSNHPRAAQALNRFLDWGDDARLSPRQRRILILRTSANAACAYEWGVHSQVAVQNAELSRAQVVELAELDHEFSGWSDIDRSLIEITDDVCRLDTVSDAVWSLWSAMWSEADLIEILIVVGYYRLCAALLNAVGVPSEGEMA